MWQKIYYYYYCLKCDKNQAKGLKYCWEACPLVALRDECSAKMWQKRVWQNTARLPNGFRSTTSLTPLLFILTNLSWKVLLYIWSWKLTIFLDALASLKATLDIKWFMFSRFQDYRVLESIAECYRILQSITECYRVLQGFTECYRVLQSATECNRVLQNVTGCYRVVQSSTGYYRV